MPCHYPIHGWKTEAGHFTKNGRGAFAPLSVPCGKCMGCRINRAQAWAIRCANEAAMHEHNAFITLTYDDKHLPPDQSLDHKHWQLFAKKLRREKGPFRFYMCGEYGTDNKRPHYHACLFGIGFHDRQPISTKGEYTLYRSEELETIWGRGLTSLGEVTFTSAGYIARYITKAVFGQKATQHYQRVNLTTGEILTVAPEYTKMSLRSGGIGKTWLHAYAQEVLTHDGVHLNDRKYKTPRYYDQQLKLLHPEAAEQIQRKRIIAAMEQDAAEHTPQRRNAKETVLRARIGLKQRKI